MESINIITIEKNIPIPALTYPGRGGSAEARYGFMKTMELYDSFKVNGNTPNFSPQSVRAYVYGLNKKTDEKYTIRTLEGSSNKPTAIRVWRIK